MFNYGKKKQSYTDRLNNRGVARGMVAPQQTPFGARLGDLSEMLNTNNGKTMRTSKANDIIEPIRMLGEPRSEMQGPSRPMADPKRAPRVAGGVGSSSGVGGIRTTSGQGIIGDIGPSRAVRQRRAVGGLEGRGARPEAGTRSQGRPNRVRRSACMHLIEPLVWVYQLM